MLVAPPPDLARDLSLTEVAFGESIWLRPPSGQGSIFVNIEMSESERRYAMARSLFIGLCATQGGREVGLPAVPNDNLKAQSDYFARRLLMAPELLPNDWRRMAPEALAELCGVPRPVAAAQLQAAHRPHSERG